MQRIGAPSIRPKALRLPAALARFSGIGSYIAVAIEQKNMAAIGWAVAAMLVVIILYDQLLFRPLVAWADRLKFEQDAT